VVSPGEAEPLQFIIRSYVMNEEHESLDNIGAIHSGCAQARRAEWQRNNKDVELGPGDFAKIAFEEKSDVREAQEHMWVEIRGRHENGVDFIGKLDNDPIMVTNVKCGAMVTFNRSEVQEVIKKA